MRVEDIVRKLVVLLIIALAFGCKNEEALPPVAVDTAVVTKTNNAPQRVVAPALGAPSDVAGGFVASAPQQPASSQPMIVRTATVKIIVGDTSKTVDAVTRSAEAIGGYVSNSHIWRDGELLRATLTLRVPSDKLTSTLAAIRGLAKRVENETISSEDVSQEYVDLESQLRNLEATEVELRELMTTIRKNAKKANEVLEMHQQLTAIRSQIEQIKGRMRYLGQVAALSAISLEIAPDLIAQPVVEPGWQPVVIVKDASRALVGVLQSVATTAIWFFVYVAPILGMLLLVIAVLWKMVRRTRTA
jgi:hypothetical protein